jgi:hypothetical protein
MGMTLKPATDVFLRGLRAAVRDGRRDRRALMVGAWIGVAAGVAVCVAWLAG